MNTTSIPGLQSVMQVPHLSTGHITEDDGAQLALNLTRDSLAIVEQGHGHIIHFEPDSIEDDFSEERGFSVAFRDMLQYLAAAGFVYVRLDPDGDTLPGLPVFDW